MGGMYEGNKKKKENRQRVHKTQSNGTRILGIQTSKVLNAMPPHNKKHHSHTYTHNSRYHKPNVKQIEKPKSPDPYLQKARGWDNTLTGVVGGWGGEDKERQKQ